MTRWTRLDEIIGRVEKFLVTLMLSVMILLAFFQIVLRNFFATGLAWGDPLVRYLVLWVGFTGATLAAREGKHIKIEVFSNWISDRGRLYLYVISNLVSTCICGLLTYAACTFIRNEAQIGSTTFFGMPVWLPQLIIPITFGLMTFRFALAFYLELSKILKLDLNGEPDKEK
jgi:TRAP-type C4-dicarboxylate transport system permease small subunit